MTTYQHKAALILFLQSLEKDKPKEQEKIK